ncbi:hypothetical protein GGX14DRAFT_558302 [Mycena pura]|uniref:Uncharacterized protein n=1 Tax=Mycena pura TaxID=153505 RepID=A0AAD6YJH8_9AGAR|nr:hypothetical protein GGX14DRAFT_558302 [Mycena pura]
MVKIRPSRAPVKRRCRTDAWQHQPDVLRNNGSMPKPALAGAPPPPITRASCGGTHPIARTDTQPPSRRLTTTCEHGGLHLRVACTPPFLSCAPTRWWRRPRLWRHLPDTQRTNTGLRRPALAGAPARTLPRCARRAPRPQQGGSAVPTRCGTSATLCATTCARAELRSMGHLCSPIPSSCVWRKPLHCAPQRGGAAVPTRGIITTTLDATTRVRAELRSWAHLCTPTLHMPVACHNEAACRAALAVPPARAHRHCELAVSRAPTRRRHHRLTGTVI